MFGKRLSVGLDVGSNTVRCAVIEADRGRIRHLWESELMPERASQHDAPDDADLQARLKAVVRTLQADVPTPLRAVTTAIQGEGTVCQYMELPAMSSKELEMAVPSMASRLIPFPMEDVVISHVPVPQVTTGERKMAVFMVAARRQIAEKRTRLLSDCGLEVQRLDLTPLALAREFSRNHDSSRERFVGLLHVGFGLTQFVAVRGSFPYYARDIVMGGRQFTYGFQMGAQSTWEAAERHKRQYDVAERAVPLEPFIQRWLGELERTLGHFGSKFSDHRITRILLSGGVAAWTGFADRISQHLGIPVDVDGWNRIQPISEHPGTVAAAFKVAVGLALED